MKYLLSAYAAHDIIQGFELYLQHVLKKYITNN